MKLKNKVLSFALSATLIATMSAVPATVFADETTTTAWNAPTQAMTVDDSIVKVGIHAAASTTSFFLGGNVVAERATDYSDITKQTTAEDKYQAALKFTRLGAFGSSSNTSPDPYLWNYFYNLAVDAGHAAGDKSADEVYLSTGAASPMAADVSVIESLGTSYTLARRPDVLMGISSSQNSPSYKDLIAQLPENTDTDTSNDYNPIQIAYAANNFQDLSNDMYNLADAINKSGKTGRYGDTYVIAQNYEKYMKGLQCYVLSKIADGTITKKNVAVITTGVDTDNDGANDEYACVTNNDVIGTSTDRPAESIMYTANNIVDILGNELGTAEITTKDQRGGETTSTEKVATLQQLAGMDAIIFGGHNYGGAEKLTKEMTDAGITNVPPIYDQDPSDVFTVRANSVENFVGIALFNGFLYPEVINPVDATMYVYENFWHLKEAALQSFAQANFANASLPSGIKTDGSTYSEAAIQNMIDDGLQYYVDENLASTYKDQTIEVSKNISLPPARSKNTLKVTKNNKTYKVKKLKKKAQSFKAVTVKKNKGKVTYSATAANAKSAKALTFNASNGKIKVAKKTKKGTYKMNVTVKAAGTSKYKAVSKTVTVTVKVKK